jgi:hypothetical protein
MVLDIQATYTLYSKATNAAGRFLSSLISSLWTLPSLQGARPIPRPLSRANCNCTRPRRLGTPCNGGVACSTPSGSKACSGRQCACTIRPGETNNKKGRPRFLLSWERQNYAILHCKSGLRKNGISTSSNAIRKHFLGI